MHVVSSQRLEERLEEREEQTLVLELQNGNSGAAKPLYALNVQAVYRAVRAQCAEDVEAEDIVQETFLKAFRSISSYRPQEGIRFLAWLLKIASTTTHKWIRSRRRLDVMAPESLQVLQERAPPAPARNGERDRDETRRRLTLALAELAERDRRVLCLRYGADMSAAETGRALGLSESNVRKICERGRRKVLERWAASAPEASLDFRLKSQ